MTFEEALFDIRGHEFAARLGVASDLRTFLRAAGKQDSVQTIFDEMSSGETSEESQRHVLCEILRLSRLRVDFRFQNPWDSALAALVWALSRVNLPLARLAVEAVMKAPQCWWAPRVADNIFEIKEEPMNSNDWVAEHVMGFERGSCWSATSAASSGSDGTFETWFTCDRCGRVVYNNKTVPCPNYPFPKFTLVDLMRKLGEKGYHVMVRVDPEREWTKFTIVLNGCRVCDTDRPLNSLCSYLYGKRETWQRLEEALGPCHGPRKPGKKRFVSSEQVLEEYIPGYERPRRATDWPTREEEPSTTVCANIRDAIRLLQKAVGQVEGK